MQRIPYTQYMRPDGRRVERTTAVPDEDAETARAFLDVGGLFSGEVLRTGEVVLYAEWDGEEVACEIVDNGPPVLDAWTRLIHGAHRFVRDEL